MEGRGTIPMKTRRNYHHLVILKHRHHNEYNVDNNNYNNNIKNTVSAAHKDLLLLPAPTEVVFNTTNSPGFYSSAIHFSQIILVL